MSLYFFIVYFLTRTSEEQSITDILEQVYKLSM